MGTIDIDYGSLGIGLLLMLIPVYFLWHFKTGLLKPVLIGTVRMIIQLFLIGAYLRFLFEWNNPFINFLWVIIMVGVAAETALTRTRLKRGILMIPISIAFFVTVVLVGLYFLGFVLKLDNIFSAQYFIPVFGIIMGNMLGVNVIGLNTYYAGLRRDCLLYTSLVGDKTIIFRLIDADMYWHFQKGDENYTVHRGIALHKICLLYTSGSRTSNTAAEPIIL